MMCYTKCSIDKKLIKFIWEEWYGFDFVNVEETATDNHIQVVQLSTLKI
jgi:hypothetical protein